MKQFLHTKTDSTLTHPDITQFLHTKTDPILTNLEMIQFLHNEQTNSYTPDMKLLLHT